MNGRVGFMVGSGYRNRCRLGFRDVFGCFRASCIFESRTSVQDLNELLDGCVVSNINVVVSEKALNMMPRSYKWAWSILFRDPEIGRAHV